MFAVMFRKNFMLMIIFLIFKKILEDIFSQLNLWLFWNSHRQKEHGKDPACFIAIPLKL